MVYFPEPEVALGFGSRSAVMREQRCFLRPWPSLDKWKSLHFGKLKCFLEYDSYLWIWMVCEYIWEWNLRPLFQKMWGFVFDILSGLYDMLLGHLFQNFFWKLTISPMLSQCWEWEKSNFPRVLSTMGSYGSKSGTVQAAHLTQWHPSPSHFSPLCHFFLHKHSLCHCLGATNDVTCLYLHFCFSNTEYTPHLLLSFEKHISPPCTVYDANLQAFFNYKRVCDDLSRDSCL